MTLTQYYKSAKFSYKTEMCSNVQFLADLVTFAEEIFNGKLHLYAATAVIRHEFMVFYGSHMIL